MSYRLSSKLWDTGDGDYVHWCPGCEGLHIIPTKDPIPKTNAFWSWDGNVEAPTFHPSVNIAKPKCHYILTAGQLNYCADSGHALAGQVVPLPDIPDWLNT